MLFGYVKIQALVYYFNNFSNIPEITGSFGIRQPLQPL